MEPRAPHYLRFARALALATTIALPACSDGDVTASEDEGNPAGPIAAGTAEAPGAGTSTGMEPRTAATAPPAATAMPDELDAGVDGPSYGKSSGPLPPPEMPASIV
jgi:hypothetical protein